MKILFCGGGTAGHITPALAIAEELASKGKSEVAFVGRKGGKENALIEKAGYALFTVNAQGLPRKISTDAIKKAFTTLKSIGESRKILKQIKPDIVFGTGGYVSFPVIIAAKSLRIKTVIHESNSRPGLVTKILGGRCDRLLTGYEIEAFSNRKNCIVTGNPVRRCFGRLSKGAARKKLGIPDSAFFILSVGGSGGAEKINESCIELMKSYSMSAREIYHIHSTGEKYYDLVKKREPIIARGTKRCKILPFIFNMAEYLSAADIIITRCGAITLSEISLSSIIPIMIPSPNVTDDHQYYNALHFSKLNAGILIEENELTVSCLTDAVDRIRRDFSLREEMLSALSKVSIPDATEKIISELYKLC